jgi:hypothetical protein
MPPNNTLHGLCNEGSLRERLFDIFHTCVQHNKKLDLVEVGYRGTYVMALEDFRQFPDLNFEQIRASHANKICRDLFMAARDPLNHISALDSVCSRFMECCFAKTLHSKDLVEKSLEIISRLPRFPLQMPQSMRFEVNNTGYLSIPEQDVTWEILKVVEYFSHTTLRIAAAIASVALYKQKHT